MMATMRAPNYFLVSVLALFIASSTAQEASFLEFPEPVNAILDATSIFSCIAIGRALNWYVDDHQSETPEVMARGVDVTSLRGPDGTINSTLTIPATMDNDNITIYCEVGGDNGFFNSPVIHLRVQGLLDSVLNLAIDRADEYNNILTWDPPFTLDITGVDPDIIAYSVCDNVTRSCQNTSDTRYVFPTLCDPVEFTISAWNPAGEGEKVSIVYEPPDDVRKSTAITSLESEVSFKSLSEPVVTLLLQVDGHCFNVLNIEFRGRYSGVREFEDLMPTVDENGTATLTFSENIMADDFYTVTVTVVQEPETGEFQQIMRETNLTTFDVQEWDVRSGDRTIIATCVFARGSQAQGCFIVIQLVSDGPPHPPIMEAEATRGELANGELEREASVSFTDLEAGTYNVLIYDVGVDGTFDLDKSLYNERIEIDLSQIVEPVPTITSASPAPSGGVPIPPPMEDTSTSLVAVAVVIPTLVVVIVLVVLLMVLMVWMKFKRQAMKAYKVKQEVTIPMRQNLSYEDSQALRVKRGPQPTDIEECPAYGVLNRQQ